MLHRQKTYHDCILRVVLFRAFRGFLPIHAIRVYFTGRSVHTFDRLIGTLLILIRMYYVFIFLAMETGTMKKSKFYTKNVKYYHIL